MQRWQLFCESAEVFTPHSVSLQHILDRGDPTVMKQGALVERSERKRFIIRGNRPGSRSTAALPSAAPAPGPCQLILTQFGPVSRSGRGGSMLKRITQNSPKRRSVTPCQLFSSIHPATVPSFARSSFHLPVCGYLCLFSALSRQYCPSVACFPPPIPPLHLLRSPSLPIANSTLCLGKCVNNTALSSYDCAQVQVKTRPGSTAASNSKFDQLARLPFDYHDVRGNR